MSLLAGGTLCVLRLITITPSQYNHKITSNVIFSRKFVLKSSLHNIVQIWSTFGVNRKCFGVRYFPSAFIYFSYFLFFIFFILSYFKLIRCCFELGQFKPFSSVSLSPELSSETIKLLHSINSMVNSLCHVEQVMIKDSH